MNTNRHWVALLTEDEDDFAYWQFGFTTWASHIQIEWFATGDAFFRHPDLTTSPPAVVVLDGLIPSNDEPRWLSRIVEHDCCKELTVIMLADHFADDEKRKFKALGARDFIIKPASQLELKEAILSVSQYVMASA